MMRARQKNPEPLSVPSGRPELQASCAEMSFGDALPMFAEENARREKSVCRLFVEA
jgi:hypothetical protein